MVMTELNYEDRLDKLEGKVNNHVKELEENLQRQYARVNELMKELAEKDKRDVKYDRYEKLEALLAEIVKEAAPLSISSSRTVQSVDTTLTHYDHQVTVTTKLEPLEVETDTKVIPGKILYLASLGKLDGWKKSGEVKEMLEKKFGGKFNGKVVAMELQKAWTKGYFQRQYNTSDKQFEYKVPEEGVKFVKA